MVPRIRVEQPTDHTLVLSAVPLGLSLEELHAVLGQRDRDCDPFLTEYKLVRRTKKLTHYSQVSEWFVGVSDSPAHTVLCLSTSSRLGGPKDSNDVLTIGAFRDSFNERQPTARLGVSVWAGR